MKCTSFLSRLNPLNQSFILYVKRNNFLLFKSCYLKFIVNVSLGVFYFILRVFIGAGGGVNYKLKNILLPERFLNSKEKKYKKFM